MQKITILGHIGRDAEIKEFPSNQVISFSVAVSESYTDSKGEKITTTTWWEVSKWGNNTQIAQYIKKGGQIYIEGKPNNRVYLKEDGTPQLVNGITTNFIQLIGGKSDSTQTPNPPRQERPQANQSNSFVDGEDFKEEEHDDLPF